MELAGEAEGGLPGDEVVAGAGGHGGGPFVDRLAKGVMMLVPGQSLVGIAEVERPSDVIACVIINVALSIAGAGHGDLDEIRVTDYQKECKSSRNRQT